jgi:hypothetical protein
LDEFEHKDSVAPHHLNLTPVFQLTEHGPFVNTPGDDSHVISEAGGGPGQLKLPKAPKLPRPDALLYE